MAYGAAVGAAADLLSEDARDAVRRLPGLSPAIAGVTALPGGQHAATWRVDIDAPTAASVIVREFPVGDAAAIRERRVLQMLDGLDGLAPRWLGGDPDARPPHRPTSIIGRLDGGADITPADPDGWAAQLGRALVAVHSVSADRIAGLDGVTDRSGGSADILGGPLAESVRARWAEIVDAPEVLTHFDFWSGNVLWRDGRLTGVVDWTGAVRGPRGFDVAWCRLDLVLLFDEDLADVFLGAYETAAGHAVGEMILWDRWATARSHDMVETWVPNYAPLGRPDLDAAQLRRRHSWWTTRLLDG